MQINEIINDDCVNVMKRLESDFIDLTVTSPPYDKLRTYNGYCFDFENVAKELFRITKQGGVVVWNVNDATEDKSESLTSFKQAIFFVEQCGFNLHDTMIWYKTNPMNFGIDKKNRYNHSFEYMFVFSKGVPSTFHPYVEQSKTAGQQYTSVKKMSRNGNPEREILDIPKIKNDYKLASNVWFMAHALKSYDHPAPFPEELAERHIKSWSNVGDLIFDPFMGSGTTAAMALKCNRRFIGCEISKDYCEMSRKRLKPLLRANEILERFIEVS